MVGCVYHVTLWGLGMSVVQSYSMPGQQAILNRVSGSSVQRGYGGHRHWLSRAGDRFGACRSD